jgi:hypothetical protein|tara:strand:- start:859 stop:1488 length:630 start_codon:yes stop_codon:yes gene_type:complete
MLLKSCGHHEVHTEELDKARSAVPDIFLTDIEAFAQQAHNLLTEYKSPPYHDMYELLDRLRRFRPETRTQEHRSGKWTIDQVLLEDYRKEIARCARLEYAIKQTLDGGEKCMGLDTMSYWIQDATPAQIQQMIPGRLQAHAGRLRGVLGEDAKPPDGPPEGGGDYKLLERFKALAKRARENMSHHNHRIREDRNGMILQELAVEHNPNG